MRWRSLTSSLLINRSCISPSSISPCNIALDSIGRNVDRLSLDAAHVQYQEAGRHTGGSLASSLRQGVTVPCPYCVCNAPDDEIVD